MARLLIVHHTPSPNLHSLLDAVRSGAGDPQISGVEVRVRAALSATASDVLDADGCIVGGPANLGALAGAVKHFFDTIYYPCLEETRGRPFGAYLHGGNDTTGAARQLASITTGLGWDQVAEVVEVAGAVDGAATDACTNLGGVVAASLGTI
ncbi:MAG: flavodoxin family protein [Iamia sp.]